MPEKRAFPPVRPHDVERSLLAAGRLQNQSRPGYPTERREATMLPIRSKRNRSLGWDFCPTAAWLLGGGSHVVVNVASEDVAGHAVVEPIVVVVDVKVGQVFAQPSCLVSDPVRLCRVVPEV